MNQTRTSTDVIPDIEQDPRRMKPTESGLRTGNKGVLVIYTGGTIGSIPKDPNDPDSPMVVASWTTFRRAVPKLSELKFPIDACSFAEPLDSSNVGPRHWVTITRIVANHYTEYEGFVVLHGTDTMVYTASALSFMLQNLDKPVIITGSQIPAISRVRNDAEQNLVTSLLIANANYSKIHPIEEVAIFFRDRLLRGNRTRKLDASGYSAFHTPNYEPLGEAGDSIEIKKDFLRKRQGQFRAVYRLNTDVFLLNLFPGFQNRGKVRDLIFDPDLFAGIIMKTYGTGNVPTEEASTLFFFSDSGVKAFHGVLRTSSSTPQGIEMPDEVKQDFAAHGIPLSDACRIHELGQESWEISDRDSVLHDTRYRISQRESNLRVSRLGFLDDIEISIRRGQVILNVTECLYGQVEQGLYDTSAVLMDRGVISGQEITPEAALCKLMVTLGQAEEDQLSGQWVIDRMSKNIAGEQDFSIHTTTLRKQDQDRGRSVLVRADVISYRFLATRLKGVAYEKESRRIERAIVRFKNARVSREDEVLVSFDYQTQEPDIDELLSVIKLNLGKVDEKISEGASIALVRHAEWIVTDEPQSFIVRLVDGKMEILKKDLPVIIRLYINLSSQADAEEMARTEAGDFMKQQSADRQSLGCDISDRAKSLTPESSLSVKVLGQHSLIEFDDVEIALFIRDEDD